MATPPIVTHAVGREHEDLNCYQIIEEKKSKRFHVIRVDIRLMRFTEVIINAFLFSG